MGAVAIEETPVLTLLSNGLSRAVCTRCGTTLTPGREYTALVSQRPTVRIGLDGSVRRGIAPTKHWLCDDCEATP